MNRKKMRGQMASNWVNLFFLFVGLIALMGFIPAMQVVLTPAANDTNTTDLTRLVILLIPFGIIVGYLFSWLATTDRTRV